MTEQIISISFGLGATLLGVILSAAFPNSMTKMDPAYIGVLSYLVSLTTFIERRVERIPNIESSDALIYRELKELAIHKNARSFDVLWSICLLRARAKAYTQSGYDAFVIEQHQIPSFWMEAITSSYKSWLCTDCEKVAEPWGYQWSRERALRFQRWAMDESAQVQRIFLFHDEGAISPVYKSLVSAHLDIGVNIRWLALNNDSENSRLEFFRDKIGTIDFAIIDDAYLLAFELSKDGTTHSLRCTRDKGLVAELKRQYLTLWDNGRLWGQPEEVPSESLEKQDSV